MKIGLSTYSLLKMLNSGEMSPLDIIDFIADNNGEHVEVVPFGFTLLGNDELTEAFVKRASERGLEISHYSILADLIKYNPDEYRAEVERVKSHIEVARKLGVKRMRHDVSAFARPSGMNGIVNFEKDLPLMVEACREIADYAAKYDIITTVENHGFYVNGSDRVQRLLHEVDRKNFRSTLDVGNFMCMDESPLMGTSKNLNYAEILHFKDFYLRPSNRDPGDTTQFNCLGSWFRTVGGDYLRGAIIAQGDIDMWSLAEIIKSSGFDGFVTVEFEGMEDCRVGSRIGMDNTRRLLCN